MKKDKLHTEKEGFKIPENYFSDFENRLSAQIGLSEIMPKTSGFKAPEGYFNSLESKILKATVQKAKTKVVNLTWLYSAAAIAAVFVIGFFIETDIRPANTTIDNLAISEIDNYLEEGYLHLNSYDIVETFNDVPLDEIQITESLSEDEIIDYLSKNMKTYSGASLDENQ
ncbi:hypothetical protein [Galbibacter sp. PAP.153]|uniref:hypothetical protein n=1 Tax=Galbibacter sp. PAP.153 TaxID=3104623 RepID=UPI0030088CCB